MYALYITHPEVVMDADVAVPLWGLSDKGRARARQFAGHPLVRRLARLVASRETKALELAAILAEGCGATVESAEAFGENDRSSTGFLPRERFEAVADAFFANPDVAVEGWESAREAQRRIIGAVEAALADHDPAQPIGFAGHGAVGTLLKCHFGGLAISRDEDQRRIGDPGGGNVFVFRPGERRLLSDWMPMEAVPEQLDALTAGGMRRFPRTP